MLVNILGFALPIEWIIALGILFLVLILTVVFLILTRNPNPTPIDKRMILKVPIDEAGIIQRGKILQNVERNDRDLIITDPDLRDDDGNMLVEECSIENKVPFPATDETKANVELWIGRTKGGQTEIVSASALMGNVPTRYDPVPADPKKLFRPLMPWGSHGSIEEIVSSKNFWAIMIPTIIACLAVGHII
jgi:hypothetical protein